MTPEVPLPYLNHWTAAAVSTDATREAVLAYHQETERKAQEAMTTNTLRPIVDDNTSALIIAGVQACVLATAVLASEQPKNFAIDLHAAARDVLKSWGLRVTHESAPTENPSEPKAEPRRFVKDDTLRAKGQIQILALSPGLDPQAIALIPSGSTMRYTGEYTSGGANVELFLRVMTTEVFDGRGGWVNAIDVEKVTT